MKNAAEDRLAGEEGPAKVVPIHGAIALAVVLGRGDDGRWRVRVHGQERVVSADPSVDPALLDEAAACGARVLIEGGVEPCVVGAVMTSRPVSYARDGSLSVSAPTVKLEAERDVTLKTPWSFLQLNQSDAELYGNRVVLKAREVARVLARLISMN